MATKPCPDCGYQMRQQKDDYGDMWRCGLCGTEYFDKELRPVKHTADKYRERQRLRDAVIAAARSGDQFRIVDTVTELDAFEKQEATT